MRRFILTYQRESHATEIEGVQFSNGRITLEHHPDGGDTSFRTISRMEYELNGFGETSIKWLDEEVRT